MDELLLKKIELIDEKNFVDYLNELVIESGSLKGVDIVDGLSLDKLIHYYHQKEKVEFISYEQKEYPFYQYIMVRLSDDKIVGAVNVRPFLTKELDENFEGNIGYSIRPSERGKGYGNKALELAIREFRKLNLKDKIFICCYRENTPSRRIIERNGGKLVEELEGILTPQKYCIE